MTAATDIAKNAEASEIAHRAFAWMREFDTLKKLDKSPDEIRQARVTKEEHKAYIQYSSGFSIKFGHIVLNEHSEKFAKAAAFNLKREDGTPNWVICSINEHSADPDNQPLGWNVEFASLVHEATHCVDGIRSGHEGKHFDREDLRNLSGKYYNTSHEINAFYHQGLFDFLNDTTRVSIIRKHTLDRRFVGSDYFINKMSMDYWNPQFINSLNKKNLRKIRRRIYCVIDALYPLNQEMRPS